MTEPVLPWLAGASRRKRWLVGVSGGLDSMAMLHLLLDAGFGDLVVCHLDHGLRGKESDGDARFVKRVGEKMGCAVEVGRVDLKALSGASGESLETAGRNARHVFFEECSRKHRCKRLLLAHHADDQAETVLWNLMRGSATCRGMRESVDLKMGRRSIHVERPLLSVRKSELGDWMRSRNFKWREDASNAVSDVVRNRLRNEAFPLLSGIAKRDVVPMLARAAASGGAWSEMMEWALEKADVTDPQGRLHVKALQGLPDALATYAFAGFLRASGVGGISAALLETCVGLLDVSGPHSVNLPGGRRLRRKEGRIFLAPDQAGLAFRGGTGTGS